MLDWGQVSYMLDWGQVNWGSNVEVLSCLKSDVQVIAGAAAGHMGLSYLSNPRVQLGVGVGEGRRAALLLPPLPPLVSGRI